MSRINKTYGKKALFYLKRNGVRKTWYAVRERLEEKRQQPYEWMPPSETELEAQRKGWKEKGFQVTFSILVPAYRTKPEYLRELTDSLLSQTYPKWELILADATEDNRVESVMREYEDSRIRYIRLEQNRGIAENTNRALPYAAGDYVGLLDHDDVLTENALYKVAAAVEEGKRRGRIPRMLYSDEDKCSGDRTKYYEPNLKEDFNLDLLLSNNYICHFLVMETALIQKLRFRPEFDGAQDYDLVLRAAAELSGMGEAALAGKQEKVFRCPEKDGSVVHIPEVLYHWRCHTDSTAENPQSKLYAYEAGRRAIQDFADKAGWPARAVDTAHVGFYRLQYEGSPFDCRTDIGAVGGRVTGKFRPAGKARAGEEREGSSRKNGRETGAQAQAAGERTVRSMDRDMRPWKGLASGGRPRGKKSIIGGRMTEEGRVLYENLPLSYSGYLHRAVLPQDGEAVDIRNIRIRPECRELFRKVTGVLYGTVPGGDSFDVSLLPENCDYIGLSLALCRALREEGYRILYLPEQDNQV